MRVYGVLLIHENSGSYRQTVGFTDRLQPVCPERLSGELSLLLSSLKPRPAVQKAGNSTTPSFHKRADPVLPGEWGQIA